MSTWRSRDPALHGAGASRGARSPVQVTRGRMDSHRVLLDASAAVPRRPALPPHRGRWPRGSPTVSSPRGVATGLLVHPMPRRLPRRRSCRPASTCASPASGWSCRRTPSSPTGRPAGCTARPWCWRRTTTWSCRGSRCSARAGYRLRNALTASGERAFLDDEVVELRRGAGDVGAAHHVRPRSAAAPRVVRSAPWRRWRGPAWSTWTSSRAAAGGRYRGTLGDEPARPRAPGRGATQSAPEGIILLRWRTARTCRDRVRRSGAGAGRPVLLVDVGSRAPLRRGVRRRGVARSGAPAARRRPARLDDGRAPVALRHLRAGRPLRSRASDVGAATARGRPRSHALAWGERAWRTTTGVNERRVGVVRREQATGRRRARREQATGRRRDGVNERRVGARRRPARDRASRAGRSVVRVAQCERSVSSSTEWWPSNWWPSAAWPSSGPGARARARRGGGASSSSSRVGFWMLSAYHQRATAVARSRSARPCRARRTPLASASAPGS